MLALKLLLVYEGGLVQCLQLYTRLGEIPGVSITRLETSPVLTLHSSLSLIALERSWLINQNIVLACICPCVDV